MLIGEYTHNQDEKKRISLPVKFRKEIGKKVVVTHGLDNCVFMYPLKEWQSIASKLGNLPIGQADTRSFNRFMLAGAVELDVDSVGRILIPEFLRDFADLNGKSIVFAGVYNRIEVWNESRWKEQKKAILAHADAHAEKLGNIGAL